MPMLEIEEVIERIKDILAQELRRRVFNKDVANALGITSQHLSMLKKRGKLPLPQLLDFCAKRKININWLLYDQDPLSLQETTQKFIYVKYFKDINASAGGGAFNYEEGYEKMAIDRQMAQMLGWSDGDDIEAINVLGDSMEPLLEDGSIVFVDKRRRDIAQGGIFLVATVGGLFIKRVVLRSDGKVEIVSENRAYPKEILAKEEIYVVGRVVAALEKV